MEEGERGTGKRAKQEVGDRGQNEEYELKKVPGTMSRRETEGGRGMVGEKRGQGRWGLNV